MQKQTIKGHLTKILQGKELEFNEALHIAQTVEPAELCQAANHLRLTLHENALDLCSIVNAKSGKCTEDCEFCAQSAHYSSVNDGYDMVDADIAITLAIENESYGVQRFSLVTAGKTVTDRQLQEFQKIYLRLQQETSLSLCASMGLLTIEKATQLKMMGVTRYHCNLETSRSYFPEVCSTHTWDDKITTIAHARAAGLEICSGGIIGMGENLEQRLELAFSLRELGVLSIPINILTPIPNTPFAHLPILTKNEILVCIAMFRLINPRAVIRIAGGRTLLGSDQEKCFTSGANGSIVGNYLTTIGNNLDEDLAMFHRLGFSLSRTKIADK